MPEKSPFGQRGWHGETVPGHDRGTGNQSPRLRDAGNETGEAKEGSLTIGIDTGSEFFCGLKFGDMERGCASNNT